MLFATPSSKGLCLLAYFFGYPALILSAFFFNERKGRALYLYGCGILYFLVQMHWLGIAKYHGTAIIFVYLFFSCVFPIGFYAFGYFLPKEVRALSFSKILQLALLFACFEYSRLFVICGFPFHTAGLILSGHAYPLILASVIGEYGLSFVVIMVGLYSTKCFVLNRPWRYGAFALLPMLCGQIIYSQHLRKVSYSEKIHLAIVQTGLLVEEKWPIDGNETSFIPTKDQLTSIWAFVSTLDGLDLICLPEACLPGDGLANRYSIEDLREVFPEDMLPFFYGKEAFSNLDVFSVMSIYLNTDILIGLVAEEKNSMFYLSQGKMLGLYSKRRLLPLGEYIPFDFLKPIARSYGLDGSFKKGESPSLLRGKWRILPTICFDEGFPGDFLSYRKDDPEFHINLSNDAWFINSKLVDSHFFVGRMRSVENGMYSIRAGNIGISAIISPTGEVVKHIPSVEPNGRLHKALLIDSFVPYRVKTIFSIVGNLGWCFIVLICAAALNGAFKSLIKKCPLE